MPIEFKFLCHLFFKSQFWEKKRIKWIWKWEKYRKMNTKRVRGREKKCYWNCLHMILNKHTYITLSPFTSSNNKFITFIRSKKRTLYFTHNTFFFEWNLYVRKKRKENEENWEITFFFYEKKKLLKFTWKYLKKIWSTRNL